MADQTQAAGGFLQSLMNQGVISPDRVIPGGGGPENTLYIGSDGFIYKPNYYTPQDNQGNATGQSYLGNVERIKQSDILAQDAGRRKAGNTAYGSKSDFLHPETGAVVGNGTADWEHKDVGEYLTLALIAAASGGAASAALGGGAAAGAGAAGGTGGTGSVAAGSGLGGFGGSGASASLTGGLGGTLPAGVGFTAGAPTLTGLGLGSAGYGVGALGFDAAAAGLTAAAGGGLSGVGGLETASEGFGPEFEQAVADGTWQAPTYPADYGQLPAAEAGFKMPTAPGYGEPSTIGSRLQDLAGGLGGAGGAGGGAGGFNWGSLVGPAASIGGALVGAKAAGDASDAQLQATREAAALTEPWRTAGTKALNRMQEILGIGGDKAAPDYGINAKPFTFTQDDPSYKWRFDQGQHAVESSAANRGGLFSGRAAKELDRYGQGAASTEYQAEFNRDQVTKTARLNPLQSMAGQGQSAASTIGGYTTQGGNAQAAGTVGTANALTTGIAGAWNNYQQNELMNRLLRS